MILSGTQRMKHLVEDLFELSKLESNQVTAQIESFSVSELVSDNAAKYELLAKNKNITISSNIPKDLPPILGDIALIDRVL